MILTEFLNDGTLIKHYSDRGVLLLQNETGITYSEPIDIVPCSYTYIETEESINQEEENHKTSDELYTIIDILTGEENADKNN